MQSRKNESTPRLTRLFAQPSQEQKKRELHSDLFELFDDPIKAQVEEEQIIAKVKSDVEKVGPRVYQLDYKDDVVQLYVFGCQGEDNPDQKEVAELMEKVATDKKPTAALILGDNIYDNGIDKPNHPDMESRFYEIYCNLAYKQTRSVPFFCALGNHDGDRSKAAAAKQYIPGRNYIYGIQTGKSAETNQVAHTYLPHRTDPEGLKNKRALFEQEKLKPTYLPKWNMPYFYYSLVIGNMQIFVLNSNSYIADYLKYIKDPDGCDRNNQAKWYATEYAKAKKEDRSVMVAQHHPLFTCGKRAYPAGGDATLYLSPQELIAINKHFKKAPENTLYNAMLLETFKKQGVIPDIIFAAHDHAMYYHNSLHNQHAPDKIVQVIAGGGGGHLQQREYFSRQSDLGAYIMHNGFVRVSFNQRSPKLVDFDFYSINGFHLSFDNHSCKPIRQVNNGNVEELRRIVLDICNNHIQQLSKKEVSDHDHGFFGRLAIKVTKMITLTPSDDVQGVHDIMNFFNQESLSSTFEEVLSQFHVYLHELYNHKEGSLYYKLNAALSRCEFSDKPYSDWCTELQRSPFAFGR